MDNLIAKVIDIIEEISECNHYAKRVVDLICSGEAHFFMVGGGFIILRPIINNDIATVHVEFAYSVDGMSFRNGFDFVCCRAKEIGANKITFQTKNGKLARLAKKLGWTKTDEQDCLSNWEFTIRG